MWKEALKKYVGVGLVGITLTDRYAGVCPVRGSSMSPTFNPSSQASFSDDYVFLEKFCLDKYRFSHGDVVYFSNPTNFKERNVKRIVAMQGDYIANVGGAIKVPEGHCWVEGDNSASSYDSRSFGPMRGKSAVYGAHRQTEGSFLQRLHDEIFLYLPGVTKDLYNLQYQCILML